MKSLIFPEVKGVIPKVINANFGNFVPLNPYVPLNPFKSL